MSGQAPLSPTRGSKCSYQYFAFYVDTDINTISPLISGFVSDALLGSKKRDAAAVLHRPHFHQDR